MPRTVVGGAWIAAWAAALGSGCGDDGQAPRVADLGEQVAVVGQPLLLRIQASDPDGDALRYEFSSLSLPMLGEAAELLPTPDGQALFSWTPVAGDVGEHVIDFVVSDGTFDTRVPTPIEVRGAAGDGSLPMFVKPVGEGIVHNLADGPCVPAVTIEVTDPDDAMLELRQEAPIIRGAQLSTSPEGLEGRWEWCPDAEQRAAAGIHELILAADDGENPPTRKRFSVWLQRAGDDCPSLPPTVDHTSVGTVELLADPEIVVSAGDDVGLSATPILFWSTEIVDEADMETVFMEQVAGNASMGTYRATVPNPAVPQGAGGTATLYYRIAVGDEDSCFARSPAEGLHELRVTNPGGMGAEICAPCSWDAQCGATDDLCLQFGVDVSACGQACTGAADCGGGLVCSPEPVISVEGVSARQCIPEAGQCNVEACEDDDREPNDDLQQALEAPPLSEGLQQGLRLCSGDEDWYAVELEQPARLLALLSGPAMPDLDLALTDEEGILEAVSEGSDSEEDLASDCLVPGSYALRVYSSSDGVADYSLSYVLDPGAC